MSHYFQPDNPSEVREAALDDWIEALAPFSREAIDAACRKYIRDQPRRRPTPGDIRSKIREPSPGHEPRQDRGDRSKLTPDERFLLDDKIVPTARRWLGIPGLKEQGERTLAYWGEMTGARE